MVPAGVGAGIGTGAGAASTWDGAALGTVASGEVLGTVLIGVVAIGLIIIITTRSTTGHPDAQCRVAMLQTEVLLHAITQSRQTVLPIVRQVAGRQPATPLVPLLPLRVAAQEMTAAYVPIEALLLHG